MSDMWGADPDALDSLATRFADSAGRVDALRTSARADLQSLAWEGSDAERFRSRWESEGIRLLTSASALLRSAGDNLRTNAADQRRTSAAEAGTITGSGGPGGLAGPVGPGGPGSPAATALEPGADYAAQIAATRQGMEDDLAARQDRLDELENPAAPGSVLPASSRACATPRRDFGSPNRPGVDRSFSRRPVAHASVASGVTSAVLGSVVFAIGLAILRPPGPLDGAGDAARLDREALSDDR